MSAVDSTKRNIYHYKDGEWVLENYTFPASMDCHTDMLKFLGLTKMIDDKDVPLGLEVYYGNYNPEYESYEYGVIISFWEDHGPLVICPKYMDLLNLFNITNGYMNLQKNLSVFHMEMNTKDTVNRLDDMEDKLDDLETRLIEIRQDVERVGNLIETGIRRVIREHIQEAVSDLKEGN